MKTLLLAITLSCFGAASAQDFCRYQTTNQLMADREFTNELARFIGDGQEKYYYSGSVLHQVFEGLGGPPDPIKSLDYNIRFASACRIHSCDEKAAVAIACPHQIIAVGIIYYPRRAAVMTILGDKRPIAIDRAFKEWKKSYSH